MIRIALLILWLGMVGWLIRYEAYPEYFTHKLAGYKSIISQDVLLVDSWMRILVDDSPVGYSYTQMEVEKSDPVNHYKINNSLSFSINLSGLNQRISIKTSSVLNVAYQLQKFYFSIKSSGYSLYIRGKKIEGEIFEITTSTDNTEQKTKVKIPEDVVIYSPMTEMAMKELKPGQEFSILTFDPVTLSKTTMTFTGEKKETILINNKEYDTTLVSIYMKGISSKVWIDSDSGQPVRQTTPFGWTLEKSNSEEALASIRNTKSQDNLLKTIAVKPSGLNVDPDAKLIRVKLSKADLKDLKFISDRQQIVKVDKLETILLVANGNSDYFFADKSIIDKDLDKFLKASSAIQSDNPKIIKTAKKIMSKINDLPGNQKSDKDKARVIFDWVHMNVKKEIVVSFPSALDVLHTMKGDCNEHTYLFVALARAAKIPARVVTGLVYTKGRFYYHAWPSVYIDGQWLEMDPTWGQINVDASHIAVVNGEIADQFQLLRLMGQLNIEILEVIND